MLLALAMKVYRATIGQSVKINNHIGEDIRTMDL